MKRLYLLRHAKSSWDDAALADHERPLSPRGRKAAKRLARHLKAERARPALVLCSSATRARETLARIEPALGKGVPVEVEGALYAASAEELLARLRRVPDAVASVLLVGHNPGLHDLALALAPGDPRLKEGLPTGALVTLDLHRLTWSGLQEGSAELLSVVVPRDL